MRVSAGALIGGLALALLCAGSVSAQPRTAPTRTPAEQAQSYLDSGFAAHGQRGYVRDPTTPDLLQPLRLDHPFLWPVYLHAGVNYRIYAACDDDCQDLDMEIYGADGMLADRDTETNDTPYVQITPSVDGRAYVRIWVYQCNSEPCFVAARLVRGGQPAERPVAAANDPNTYESVVSSELDDSGRAQLQAGYAKLGEDFLGPLTTDSGGHREVIHLDAGKSYAFQGACDQDCSDVDMEVLDPRGDQVARDVATDDRPLLRVAPTRAGDYTVRIWLASCSTEPCYVGLRSYVRQGR